MALTANRTTPSTGATVFNDPVYGGVHIYCGAAVGIDSSGYLRPMVPGVALKARGVATEEVDATNFSSGALSCSSQAGVFLFRLKGGDAPTAADIQSAVYFEDDQTVSKTSNSGANNSAGRLVALVSHGGSTLAAVATGHIFSVDGDLVAANNLSDVASAATARGNIGANQVEFTFTVRDLVNANAVGFVAPKAFTITKIKSVLLGHALATGNATLTGRIGSTAITSGALTITQSGSAIGDVDTASPSAQNVVAEDNWVNVLVGGTNTDTDAYAIVTVFGTY